MKIQDVMSTPSATCRTSASLAEAAAIMWTNDCGALPVVDQTDKVVGIITDRDICIAAGTRELRADEILVSSVISYHVSVVHPDDEVATALQTMQEHRVHRLPVVDDDFHALGVVSINDLILRSARDAGENTVSDEAVLSTLKGISAHLLPALVSMKPDLEIIADGYLPIREAPNAARAASPQADHAAKIRSKHSK